MTNRLLFGVSTAASAIGLLNRDRALARYYRVKAEGRAAAVICYERTMRERGTAAEGRY
jgi:hypothetical protein